MSDNPSMSAIRQMHAVLRAATSSKGPLGTGYTGKEIRDAIAAGRSDDRKLDAREKNLLSYYLTYRGNGMNDSGTREFMKAYRELKLPRNPVTDREFVRNNKAPTLQTLRAAQNRVSHAVLQAGANSIGVADGLLRITIPSDDSAARAAIRQVMRDRAPGIPFQITVAVFRPE